MMKLSHFFFLILIPVLYSCSSDEHYLDFTIEKQDIKIAKAFWGRIKILSGNMDYSINNLNSDIAEAYIYEDGEYGNIVIKPIQKGKATIEITDNICHTSIIIKAEVVDNEIGTIIRESNHPLFETTRSAPPPKAHWLRMKGINNEYNINCIASTDEGYDIEGETR